MVRPHLVSSVTYHQLCVVRQKGTQWEEIFSVSIHLLHRPLLLPAICSHVHIVNIKWNKDHVVLQTLFVPMLLWPSKWYMRSNHLASSAEISNLLQIHFQMICFLCISMTALFNFHAAWNTVIVMLLMHMAMLYYSLIDLWYK